ncbi:potassium transporter Kup [Novosphingobium sp. Gsoil 351]|uniref:potassium transporter Kup n=1 Tax=Novosphingobium sp. Gsoil 351 TaxID=2675225 RepID=UPI0012B4EF04|nr:potassium transporter Kup [Novosphingobium sp. Gsoil 351]QGN56497.1 potassium transporter Kup [Novosphingobium sp. Gsoil 351]
MDATASTTHSQKDSLPVLMIGAIGVVYGDIGTSPLYALKESFIGPHPLAIDRLHIFGVLSLIFWSLMLIVTVKYVAVAMRADNRGEGGSFALLALMSRHLEGGRWTASLVMLGVLAASLFYGDAMLTPAISVLSAVEGLTIVEVRLAPLVLPISVVILIALFLIQARGTAKVGALLGPVVLIYFATLATLGVANIAMHPEILGILNPYWVFAFFDYDPRLAFLAMGSVFLAVTGAETLYADMGHFGRKAIGLSWLTLVYPCLMLNYMGQGALLLETPAAVENPFYLMAPEWARLPLVLIATAATIIASQAVISGAFSVTHQAVQLGFLPRLRTLHTSEKAAGQIYIPAINWGLLIMVLLLVLGFRESTRLASAYGISVVGTMLITTVMLGFLVFQVWRWNRWLASATIGIFLAVDALYFASNITKIPDGGWFPLVVAGGLFTILTTWATGRKLMRARLEETAIPLTVFIKSARSAYRVSGTAIFLSATPDSIPSALLHNLKHNQVMHERVLILTVAVGEVPFVESAQRIEVHGAGDGFYQVVLHYGFMQEVDIPRDLSAIDCIGGPFNSMTSSFFLGRQKLIASKEHPGMALWRERLFAWMTKSSESAMEFFRLPTNRVVELGSQLQI